MDLISKIMYLALISLIPFVLSQEYQGPNHPEFEHFEINAEDESAKLMKEWEEHMKDFVPADMVTFEVSPRGEDEFFEEIDTLPSFVRGAWFVSSVEANDIDFTILDPLRHVIFQRKSKREAIFYFDANRKGIYSFIFKNNKILQKRTITFALHCGNSTSEVLTKEHLGPIESEILTVSQAVKDFQLDLQFAQLRQETHFKSNFYSAISSANRDLLWLSLLECAGIIGVTMWQVFYIKKLLDNRRMV